MILDMKKNSELEKGIAHKVKWLLKDSADFTFVWTLLDFLKNDISSLSMPSGTKGLTMMSPQ